MRVKEVLTLAGTALVIASLWPRQSSEPNVNLPFSNSLSNPAETSSLMLQQPKLCVRADNPDIMAELKEIGVSKEIGVGMVRIWGPWEELLYPDSQFRRTIKAAQDNGITPLVVFSPNISLPEEIINRTVNTVIDAHVLSGKSLVLEAGNEPDHPANPPGNNFWRGDIEYTDPQRLLTFAEFVYLTHKAIREHERGADIPIIIGALFDPNRQKELMNYLAYFEITLDKDPNLLVAIHGYNTKIDISAQVNAVVTAGVQPERLILTELGADTDQLQAQLDQHIAFAESLGINISCIHEVKKVEDNKWVNTPDELRDLFLKLQHP